MIDTKQITRLLQQKPKVKQYATTDLDLTVDNLSEQLTEMELQESQAESSTQTQIQQQPK